METRPGDKRLAMSYTDAELEAMMVDLESGLVKRKESAQDGSRIRRNICAFANDLPRNSKPGVLLIGVRDNGSCASLQVDDALLTRLANIPGEGQILPLPSMTVQKRILRGCEVAVVAVAPSSAPPVRFRGRVWVRVGPSVREGSVADERNLAERRRARDLPFDSRPADGASLAALDTDFVRDHYLPNAIDHDVLRHNTRSFDEQLHSLRLAHDGVPTWGGLIAFATDPLAFVPGASVQFLRLDGEVVTAPIVNQRTLAGRLDDVVRQLNELLSLNIAVSAQVAGSLREQRHPEYPLDALRQLAHNAIMHRSYEGTHTPVRLYWYADRVEIASPGGLYGRMTPEKLRPRRHRLPQSAARGSDGQPRLRAALRPRHSVGQESAPRKRQPTAGVPFRATSRSRNGASPWRTWAPRGGIASISAA